MKKLISALLLGTLLCTSCAGCHQDTGNTEPDVERIIEFNLDADEAHGGLLRLTEVDENGNETTTDIGGLGILAAENETVESAMTAFGYLAIEPVRDDDTFEGWLEYKSILTTDKDGFTSTSWEFVSDNLYTTDDLMQMIVPETGANYIAKWASIPVEDYFKTDAWDTVTTTGSFSLSANGGAMTFFLNDAENDAPTYTYWLEGGQALNDIMGADTNAALIDIQKADATFSGWTLYEADSAWWNSESVEEADITSFLFDESNEDIRYLLLENATVIRENASTEELGGISVADGKSYFAQANWN